MVRVALLHVSDVTGKKGRLGTAIAEYERITAKDDFAQLWMLATPNSLEGQGVTEALTEYTGAGQDVLLRRELHKPAEGIHLNTDYEISAALEYAQLHGFDEIMVVSSDFHIGRCLTELVYACKGTGIRAIGVAAETTLPDMVDEKPTIIEGLHNKQAPFAVLKGDDQFHRVIRRVFKLKRKQWQNFVDDLKALMESYGI